MNDAVVRIQQIELINFKNIEHGTVTFPSYLNVKHNDNGKKKAEIIGIYGQNGSGKTALVDAMWLLEYVLKGKKLPLYIDDFILQGALAAQLKFVFSIDNQDSKYLVFYDLEIRKDEDSKACVSKENLSYKILKEDKWGNKISIIEYDRDYKDTIFKPVRNFKLLTSNKQDNRIELGVAKKLSEKNMTSFIFSHDTQEVIKSCEAFGEYINIILALKHYADLNMFILKNNNSGMINMNLFIPFSYRMGGEKNAVQRELSIGLLKPSVVSEEIYEVAKNITGQMNIVLGTIIPGLKIEIVNHGRQLKEDGTDGMRIELVSARKEVRIPLKYESDGIKKIISVLSSLINMFNNPSVCMVVDELDAGIFEYLLGEILRVVSESGKGQLIFTSHNLRPLEMLDTDSLVFTTTNPKNRYLKFTRSKKDNNLRSLYYRSINLGGQKEEIYEETNSFEISRAFRVAGRVLDEH